MPCSITTGGRLPGPQCVTAMWPLRIATFSIRGARRVTYGAHGAGAGDGGSDPSLMDPETSCTLHWPSHPYTDNADHADDAETLRASPSTPECPPARARN